MKKEEFSNRHIAKKFDSVAETFDYITNSYCVARRYKEIAKYINGKSLEIGAGTGSSVSKYYNSDYVLTDLSYKMCKVAAGKHKNKVICCDAEKLPFPSNTFDTIVSSEVIYYLSNPEFFVKEAYRVLKKRGKLIISSANQDMKVHDKMRKILRTLGLKRTYFDDPVNSFMRLKDLKKLLLKNKFRIKVSRKIILFPFKTFHKINLIAEKTFLKHFGIFILVVAEKSRK